jgi:hypothetical protein
MVLPDGRFISDEISEKIKISDSEATNQNVQMFFSLPSILLSYHHPRSEASYRFSFSFFFY